DLRQDTVLRKTDWIRVQDDLRGVNKEKQRLREAAKQREALHLQSKEVVKLWSNTTTFQSQRQKKLEAKKIREQIEEEERKRIVDEEANFKEQQRQEAIEKARTQMYYQTNRVKGLHQSALLLTEVLKEREAQIELKRRIESASKDVDTKFLEAAKTREDEALKQEQEKALQRRLQRQAAAEDLKNMKENELAREQQKLEDKKDGEEIQRLQELHQWERKMESERQANQKRDLMQAHLDHINKRALIRVQDEEKQEAEEEQRKLFVSAKEKMMNLRKEREQELFDAQLRRERILNTLTVTQQERTATDEQRVAKAVAEQDAKQAQLRREEERKKSEMLKSITAHRELAEKTARFQRQKEAESKFEEKNAQLITEEENKFHQYSQLIISEAAEAKKNLFPLRRAARQGTRGGDGPASGGAEPVYLVHDSTGAHMPKYVSVTTENIKKLRQPGNIQEAKKRLGFTW
uniref:Cilia and flagella associated protein 210 n=1 Tax=Kryptolebias marmoratus TaxID=37003 RepID=A0A3Q3BA44_KRYMA